MTLVEYAEKELQRKLSECEKCNLQKIEENIKNDVVILTPPRSGKTYNWRLHLLVYDWLKTQELKEHRCSCGRLLGRFNGQAEVKCPKCGKMNVIGVENHADSGIAR